MYGQNKYGMLQFGAEDETTVPDGNDKTDLMKYLPSIWHDLAEMRALQGVAGIEVGELRKSVDEILKQSFVSTATWGLEHWEKELEIATDLAQTFAHRREIILAKLRGAGITAKAMIKSVASAFSGGDVDVIEYPGEYRFEVKFIGSMGIPTNMSGIIRALEEIKPAHLVCSFSYTYTVWLDLFNDGITWNKAAAGTWDALKAYT